MSIEGMITPLERTISAIQPLTSPNKSASEVPAGGPGFTALLKEQLDEVVDLQNKAEQAQQDLLSGKTDDIFAVVLAVQQADITLNYAIELRNKVIEAYTEISRMQL